MWGSSCLDRKIKRISSHLNLLSIDFPYKHSKSQGLEEFQFIVVVVVVVVAAAVVFTYFFDLNPCVIKLERNLPKKCFYPKLLLSTTEFHSKNYMLEDLSQTTVLVIIFFIRLSLVS